MVGKICEKGRSWAASERERELWLVRVVSWESKKIDTVRRVAPQHRDRNVIYPAKNLMLYVGLYAVTVPGKSSHAIFSGMGGLQALNLYCRPVCRCPAQTESVLLWPPYVIGGHYIFALWFLSIYLLSSSFFSSPNLSGHRLDLYHTSTHGVALVRI